MKKLNYYNLFCIFIIGSIFGWFVEGIFTLIKKGILINHSGLVIGPFNLIYGFGAVMFTILLYKYRNSNVFKIFLISFVGGTLLEYIGSIWMEYVVGFRAWDYSKYFLNIQGRVCLLYSIYWGILGILWIKVIYPFLNNIINNININNKKKFVAFMIIFLIIDELITVSAINRAHDKDNNIEARNKYEELLDKTFNKDYLKNMYNNHWK